MQISDGLIRLNTLLPLLQQFGLEPSVRHLQIVQLRTPSSRAAAKERQQEAESAARTYLD